jgi:hypothetical protein
MNTLGESALYIIPLIVVPSVTFAVLYGLNLKDMR